MIEEENYSYTDKGNVTETSFFQTKISVKCKFSFKKQVLVQISVRETHFCHTQNKFLSQKKFCATNKISVIEKASVTYQVDRNQIFKTQCFLQLEENV